MKTIIGKNNIATYTIPQSIGIIFIVLHTTLKAALTPLLILFYSVLQCNKMLYFDFLAIIIAVKILGPFVGFAMSAAFLKIYVTPGKTHGTTLNLNT